MQMKAPAAAMAAALLCAVLLAATAGAQDVVRSACGIELSRGAPVTPGGPICGTDEGDDVGLAGEDTPLGFFGENGHDTVEGSRYGDTLSGGAGNDEIHGGRGEDRIDGGDDSDVLFGGLGDDVIRERRFGVREELHGGPGNDTLDGGRGSDTLFGGTGGDILLGGSGSDVLYGGPGNDTLYGGPNRDTFDCGPGVDTVHRVRTSSDESSSTGRHDAFIPRSAGCERIVDSDPTADFPLRDVLGTDRRDDLFGGGGGDLLQGKGNGDRLFASAGNDELEGDGATNQGDDLLMGGSGADRLAGRAGDDRLYGDARSPNAGPPGDDELSGGSGADLLVGGPGRDLLLGAYDGDRILAGVGDDVVTLLGGDTSDPNGRVTADCGRGFDVVVINPARRGSFRNCESFVDQFHEADYGFLFRPSPEVPPPGAAASGPSVTAAASRAPARRAPSRLRQPAQPAPGAPAATDADGGASAPSISFDGSRVAFSSDAANLIDSDENAERTDAFVRDLPSGRTLLADATSSGRTALRGGRLRRGPAGGVSADGRYTVFSTNSRDLPEAAGAYSIFRRDLAVNTTEVACRAGDDDSESPVISAGGQHVAFESRATDLAGTDANRQTDVYWCDMSTGEIRRVSQPINDSVNAVGSSLQPSISGDGRYVAFVSDAGGLVAGGGERAGVYWRDMQSGETRLVDVPPGLLTSNGNGQNPKISDDGRHVVFDSNATDLLGGSLNGDRVDVFRKDMVDGTVTLVSQALDGSAADGDSTADSLSGDGQTVAFTSTAPNLSDADGNSRSDVFVRNLATGTLVRASSRPDGGGLAGPSSGGAVSGDGRFVAFGSRAPDVLPGQEPSARTRIYRKDLLTAGVELVTVGLDLPPRSLVAEPHGVVVRRRARLVAGTVTDTAGVAHVQVSVSRRIGGNRCLWLSRAGRLLRGACDRPRALTARLTSGLRFTLRIGRLLPRGTYVIRSQATDSTGNVEDPVDGRSVVSVRLK